MVAKMVAVATAKRPVAAEVVVSVISRARLPALAVMAAFAFRLGKCRSSRLKYRQGSLAWARIYKRPDVGVMLRWFGGKAGLLLRWEVGFSLRKLTLAALRGV